MYIIYTGNNCVLLQIKQCFCISTLFQNVLFVVLQYFGHNEKPTLPVKSCNIQAFAREGSFSFHTCFNNDPRFFVRFFQMSSVFLKFLQRTYLCFCFTRTGCGVDVSLQSTQHHCSVHKGYIKKSITAINLIISPTNAPQQI